MTEKQKMVKISLETLRHLFDLAMDSPLVCSGSFDSHDVNTLRAIADLIGVDKDEITPDEFIRDYPHKFVPRTVNERPMHISEYITGLGNVTREYSARAQHRRRYETAEEVAARVAEERSDLTCHAGSYNRRCGRTREEHR